MATGIDSIFTSILLALVASWASPVAIVLEWLDTSLGATKRIKESLWTSRFRAPASLEMHMTVVLIIISVTFLLVRTSRKFKAMQRRLS